MTFIPMQGKCPHCGRDDCMPELTTLNKRIAELEEKIEEYESAIRVYDEAYDEIKHELAKMRDKNRRLREALVSIADGDIYPRSIAKQALEKET